MLPIGVPIHRLDDTVFFTTDSTAASTEYRAGFSTTSFANLGFFNWKSVNPSKHGEVNQLHYIQEHRRSDHGQGGANWYSVQSF